jgi:predicted secreted protein
MAVIHGRKIIVKVGGTAIAGAKSCEISIKGDQIETASPTTGEWRDFIAGRKEWSVTCGHLIPASGTPLKSNAAMVNTVVTLTIETDMTGDTLTGQAIVETWKASGTVGNLATGTFQFKGKGALE